MQIAQTKYTRLERSIRIAFDVRPGNSGPGRYVGSIVQALAAPEWNVQFFDASHRVPTPRTDVRHGGSHKTATGARLLTRVVPQFVRYWLGFRGEANHLAHALRSMPVDLFHTQKTGCEALPVAARLARVPRVLGTFHVDSTVDLDRSRSGLTHRAMEWYSNRSLHLAIAVSDATKRDWMQRTRMRDMRVVTIHNGINPEKSTRRCTRAMARAQLNLPQSGLVLGGLGRLEPAKGFEYLIEALATMRSDFPNIMVAIAGEGSLREQLANKARSLGVRDRVVFLGFQSDVNVFLDACDVFVIPSLSETLGYALLEAMAHELPAVGSAVGGIPEVIVPGETGFLVTPRSGVVLAKAIRPLLESAELRLRLGRSGRLRVIKHFHEADMVRKTIAVYRQMLAVANSRRCQT